MDKKPLIVKWLAVGIILLFVGIAYAPSMAQNTEKQSASRGTWLYVGGSGPGNYSRIQDAVDNASDGDTIVVYYNIYNEDIIINKQLSLCGISESGNKPIIKGINKNVVTISADNCVFDNFKVEDPYYYFSIKSNHNLIQNCDVGAQVYLINCSLNTISNNSIHHKGIIVDSKSHANNFTYNNISYTTGENWHCGIRIAGSANNTIRDNIFYHDWRGVYLNEAKNITLIDNIFEGCNLMIDGSLIEHYDSHIIENNRQGQKMIYYLKNNKGVIVPNNSSQVFLVNCSRCLINGLEICNYDYSINLYFSSNNNITNNSIRGSRNQIDIFLYFSSSNYIAYNNFDRGYAVYSSNSHNNTIYKNSLVNSTFYVYISDKNNNNNILTNNLTNSDIWVLGNENIIKDNVIISGTIHVGGFLNLIKNNIIRNTDCGIEMGGGFNIVSGNYISKCIEYGIFDLGAWNVIQGNTFKNNVLAIKLYSGRDVITRNQIQGNLLGISIIGGLNNRIHDNNFMLNVIDAHFRQTFLNIWFNNYWGRPLFHPKIIFGIIGFSISPYPPIVIGLPWLNFDLRPRLIPVIIT